MLINNNDVFNTYMSNLEYSMQASKIYADAEENSTMDWHGLNFYQRVTS